MKPVCRLMLVFFCTSCTTYQYATINSPLKQDNSGLLIVETDTVTIKYDFSGENGPVRIQIFNKLSSPLYVDWSKSALIVEDVRRSYLTYQSTLEGSANSTDRRSSRTYSTQDVAFAGIITSRESMAFIPPQSWANEHQLDLNPGPLSVTTPGSRYTSERVKGINMKSYYYDQSSSPLRFRSFLTVSFKQDMSAPIYFDHSFWISEIVETEITPSNFPRQTNQFYTKKPMQ